LSEYYLSHFNYLDNTGEDLISSLVKLTCYFSALSKIKQMKFTFLWKTVRY